MADDTELQGPLGSPAGQVLQRGMNFLFGSPKPQPKGMVPPAQAKATPPTVPLGSGLLQQAGSAMATRPAQIDATLKQSGG